jgi:integrase
MDAARDNRWGHRDATAILLAYRHGLRASELVALRWDDISLQAGKLHVRRSKGGETSVHPLGARELRALRRLQRETPEGQHSPYVFVSERTTPLKRVRLSADGGPRRGCRRLPVPVSSHVLRHSCGVQAGQRWSGYAGDPALSRAPLDRLDGAVHKAGAGQVQRVLEGLRRWCAPLDSGRVASESDWVEAVWG